MEGLWRIVEREKITVRYKNLLKHRSTLFGLYFYDDFEDVSGPAIILDKSLTNNYRLHRCVLAEEIGHFFTAPRTNYLVAYTSYTTEMIMSQDERKALQWATDYLMPNNIFRQAVKNGFRTVYDLAEFFDVTEWMVYRKINFLEQQFPRKLSDSQVHGIITS